MAVPNQIQRVSYAGDGTTTEFTFGGIFYNQADLVVILKDDATGVETVQTITTHYTVAGVGDAAGGEVTFLTAPASGKTVVIYRDPQLLQPTVFVEGGALPAKEIEKSDDRAVLMAQRNSDIAKRAVRLTDGFAASFNPVLPETLGAGVTIVVNQDADGFEAGPTAENIADAETNAIAAAASATAAGVSASAADASAIAAAASETAAGLSEVAAAASETAAGLSETAAGLSETAAGVSAGDADASAIAAAASETAAGLSEVAAAASETAAGLSEAAALAAAAQLEAAFYRAVVHVDSGDSPLAITSADNGKLFVVDSSGGAIAINMPEIGTLATPFNISVKLATAGNLVTINANAADKIGGEDDRVLSQAEESIHLVADTGPTPDNWVVLDFSSAGAGAGGINHIAEPSANFEGSQVGDWEVYANDTPGASPTLDDLGTPNVNVTFAASDTDPLRGEYSGLLTKDASDRQGHGIRIPFTIDNQDRANGTVYVSFDLETSADYVPGDVLPFVWNDTTDEVVELKRAGSSGRFIGSFTPQAASGYQLALHIATDNAAAYTVKVDNFIVGPDKLLNGIFKRSVVLDATGSGDFTGGSVRVTRVGGLVSISVIDSITWEAGTPKESAAGFIPDWAVPESQKGNTWKSIDTGSRTSRVDTDGKLRFEGINIDGTPRTSLTNSGVLPTITYTVEDTESDLLSTTELLNQTLISKHSSNNEQTIGTTLTTVIFENKVSGNSGAYNSSTGMFTAPETGTYIFDVGLRLNATVLSTSQRFEARVQNDDTGEFFIADRAPGNGATNIHQLSGSVSLNLKSGEKAFVGAISSVAGDLSNVAETNHLTIRRIPDFSVFGATSLGSLIGYHVIDTVGANTYTRNPLAKKIKVTALSGGGGGGGCEARATAGESAAGTGGGGGGLAIKVIDNAIVNSTETVTVGAGGAGGAAGLNNGSNGGTTSFGAHCSATGGGGGELGASGSGTSRNSGGSEGFGVGGDLNINGQRGWNSLRIDGEITQDVSGGGNALFQSSGNPTTNAGSDGRHWNSFGSDRFGVGGGAGRDSTGGTARAGGVGGPGLCIVEEYA